MCVPEEALSPFLTLCSDRERGKADGWNTRVRMMTWRHSTRCGLNVSWVVNLACDLELLEATALPGKAAPLPGLAFLKSRHDHKQPAHRCRSRACIFVRDWAQATPSKSRLCHYRESHSRHGASRQRKQHRRSRLHKALATCFMVHTRHLI
jgi:hypothetical protein